MSPRTQDTVDEETPLLQNANAQRKATPLPVTQISILLLLLLAEPITSLSINPYINQVCVSYIASCEIASLTVDILLFSWSANWRSLAVMNEKWGTTQAS